MGWFALALLATLLMTVINFGDKFIVSRQIPETNAVLIYFGLVNLVFAFGLWALAGFTLYPAAIILPLMLSGALITWGNLFYLQAMAADDASKIIVLAQIQPVLVLLISLIFFGEQFSASRLIGFALIITAAVALSASRQTDIPVGRRGLRARFQSNGALWLMLTAATAWAFSAIAADSALGFVIDTPTLMLSIAYASFGYGLGSMALYVFVPPVRHSFNRVVPTTTAGMIGSAVVIETTFVIRQWVLFSAYSLGPVALISVIGSTNVFFGIAIGWALTLIVPHLFKEDIRRETLIHKAIWAAVMFAGLVLIR